MALSSSARAAAHDPAHELIQERYRVERLLGKGGMGEVLLVHDLSTNRQLALKRLLPNAKPSHVLLFSREFHTLAGLSHPHVVQAYDYGLHGGVPFYTMELLSGSDMQALAPLPWLEVARTLRDVSSALAMIHARSLVHRDVTARNVWRTAEGVVKLIDFGALSSFGEARSTTGTPPFVAPEAVRTRTLDQRTDLYSLGALGYFLLTGRHAYPARSLAELEGHWRTQPLPATQRVRELGRSDLPDVPVALEQLLDSLLAHEPAERPHSAADVLDRLAQLLPANDNAEKPAAAHAQLASKAFVGRETELTRLRALHKQSCLGLGTSALVVGAQGAGRSRLLGQLGVEARLAGSTVIAIKPDGENQPLSAATRCALSLLECLPNVARKHAAAHCAVLAHLSDELREQLGVAVGDVAQIPHTPGEARMRLQLALSAWWLEIAREHSLVLLLDDLQDMDEPSVSLFAALSRELRDARVLLVGAATRRGSAFEPCVQAFADKALPLELGALSEPECTSMLGSMFGDVEHLARASRRLCQVAEGHPGRLTELCEHLVRSERIRYVDGSWMLPQEIGQLALPKTRSALEEARLSALSSDARALAQLLSVTDGVLPLELCDRLAQSKPTQLFASLAELVSAGVLAGVAHGYRFEREPLRTLLSQTLPDQASQRAHKIVGDYLLCMPQLRLLDRARAGLHLLRGGEYARGAQVINHAALEMLDQLPDDVSAIAAVLEQALPLLRARYQSDHELLPVLCALAKSGFFSERRLGMIYGDEALARGQRVLGLTRARSFRRFLGRKWGLLLALFVAGIVCKRWQRKSPVAIGFQAALSAVAGAAGSLASMYAVCVWRERALSSAQVLEPFSALGQNHVASVVHAFAMGCVYTVQDKLGQTAAHWQAVLQRLRSDQEIKGLTAEMRVFFRCAALFAYGITEGHRDSSRALEVADELEREPLMLYRLGAEQLRALYMGYQGDSKGAAHHRARVEVHALQRGASWQIEIWNPSSIATMSFRQRDAMSVKRAAAQLHQLASDTPSLRATEHRARTSYLLLRERFQDAAEQAKQARDLGDREAIGTTNGAGLLAAAYNNTDRPNKARAVCMQALARLSPEDLTYPPLVLSCQIELAHAEAGLGNYALAARQLDELLAQHKPQKGPLTLGALHEARALVAQRAGEVALVQEHSAAMSEWYRRTGCVPLIQHGQRINQQLKGGARNQKLHTEMQAAARIATGLSSALDSPERLLARAMQTALAADGVLFLARGEQLDCITRTGEELLTPELEAWANARYREGLSYATETEDSELGPVDQNAIVFGGKSWSFFLLVDDDALDQPVVGALALSDTVRMLPPDTLRTLAVQLRSEQAGQ